MPVELFRFLDGAIDGKHIPATIALQFEWRDLWLGVYVGKPYWESGQRFCTVYVCLIPMLPLLINWRIPPSRRFDG